MPSWAGFHECTTNQNQHNGRGQKREGMDCVEKALCFGLFSLLHSMRGFNEEGNRAKITGPHCNQFPPLFPRYHPSWNKKTSPTECEQKQVQSNAPRVPLWGEVLGSLYFSPTPKSKANMQTLTFPTPCLPFPTPLDTRKQVFYL